MLSLTNKQKQNVLNLMIVQFTVVHAVYFLFITEKKQQQKAII